MVAPVQTKAVWPCFRLTRSLSGVEELMAQRGGAISVRASFARTTAPSNRIFRSGMRAQDAGLQVAHAAQRVPTTHAAIYNVFAHQRHLIGRRTLRIFRERSAQAWAATVA